MHHVYIFFVYYVAVDQIDHYTTELLLRHTRGHVDSQDIIQLNRLLVMMQYLSIYTGALRKNLANSE